MRTSRKISREINAGSMADIAFLLLVFFLVTTTLASDIGLQRKLPQTTEESVPIIQRNIFQIWVNGENQVLVNGERVDEEQIVEETLNFFGSASSTGGPQLISITPEKCQRKLANGAGKLWLKKQKAVEILGSYQETKAVISLQADRSTSYNTYIRIQDQLATAYRLMREQLGNERLNKPREEWTKWEVEALKTAIPQRISEAEPVNYQN